MRRARGVFALPEVQWQVPAHSCELKQLAESKRAGSADRLTGFPNVKRLLRQLVVGACVKLVTLRGILLMVCCYELIWF